MAEDIAAPRGVDVRRLRPVELVQLGAAGVVFVSLFMDWYTTDSAIPTANVEGHSGGVSAWAAHPVLRWLLVAAMAAALLSAWQTIAAHEPGPGWHRGETSVVVAGVVVVLIVFQGWIDRPGDPPGAIGLGVGWFVAMAAALVAMGAAIARLPRAGRTPPGV